MIYDYEKIGKRIKKERQLRNESQEIFGKHFNVKRQTVASWEHGNTIPNFINMIDMCKLFECEMGYILCEKGYDNKTRVTTDIQQETGLSEDAINLLIEKKKEAEENYLHYNQSDNRHTIKSYLSNVMSHIITNSDELLPLISKYQLIKDAEHQISRHPFYKEIRKAYDATNQNFEGVLAPYDTLREIFVQKFENIIGHPDEASEFLFRLMKDSDEINGVEFALSRRFITIIEKYALDAIEYQEYNLTTALAEVDLTNDR